MAHTLLPIYVAQDGHTRTKDVVQLMQATGGVTIAPSVAARAKRQLQDAVKGEYDCGFSVMEDFLGRFKTANPMAVVASKVAGVSPKVWRGSFILLPNAQVRPMRRHKFI